MRSIPIVLVLALSLFTFSACSRAQEQSNTAENAAENTAPDFTLETITGETIILSEILKQKKAVLVFWATWCSYCRKEIPHIEEFYKENKDKVEVVGINIKESRTKVETFAKKRQISYPIALDSDGSVAGAYNVRGIPAVVAVDKDSRILYQGHSIAEMTQKVDF